MNSVFVLLFLYLLVRTVVLWALLSALCIFAWRSLDNLAERQGWWA